MNQRVKSTQLSDRRGQALLELAIFGMVALAAVGFMIRVGMTMNFEQEVRMGAFRKAMAAAASDDGTFQDAAATGYYLGLDRQMPNPSDGFVSLPRQHTNASGYVSRGDHLTFAYQEGEQTQPVFFVQVNNSIEQYRQKEYDTAGGMGFARTITTVNSMGGSITQPGDGTGSASGGTGTSTTIVGGGGDTGASGSIGGGGTF